MKKLFTALFALFIAIGASAQDSATLQALITQAEAIDVTQLNTRGAADLAAAITTAQAVTSNYAAAVNALQTAIDTANAIIPAYDAYQKLKTSYEEVVSDTFSIVREASTRTTFENAISTASTAVEAASTADDLSTAAEPMTTAYQTYAQAAYPASGKQFDMTFMMVNPQVANTNGWTNGKIDDLPTYTNRVHEYKNAPDRYFLYVASNEKRDMYQEVSNLPEGNYSVKVATLGVKSFVSAEIKAYVYAQSNLKRNEKNIRLVTSKIVTENNGELGYYWYWTNIPAVMVGDGYLKIGFWSDNKQAYSGADDFHLYRAFDTSELAAELEPLIVEARELNVAPISDALNTDLSGAINCGEPFTISEFLNAINALKTAIDTVKAWKTAYNEAKAPLVAALDRAAAYVNDDNTAKQAMSAGTWQPLQTAVIAAREANAVTNSYDNFAAHAEALNTALSPADNSVALWSRYTTLKNGLNTLDNSILNDVADNNSTDADVAATTTAMVNAADSWLTNQYGIVNVNALLGDNLDFETATGALSFEGSNVYDVAGWSNTFTTTAQPEEDYRERTTADSNVSGSNNMLRMRTNKANATMQINKSVMLPKGHYELKVWIKKAHTETNPTELNYVEANDTCYNIGGTDAWSRQSVKFELTEASLVNLSLGFISGTAEGETEIFYDDITLTYGSKTFYREALDAATDAYNSDANKLALKSALDEFTYTEDEEQAKSDAELDLAIDVLYNAITIESHNGEATTLWKNHDFMGGVTSYPLQDGNTGKVNGPNDWTLEYDLGGKNDPYVKNGFFKFWAEIIRYGNLYQTVYNLPNGTYKISADIMTNKKDASSWIALYGNPGDSAAMGRSANVYSSDSKNYSNHAVYVNVANHSLTAGIRTDNGYFQVTNIKVEFVAPNATETANGRLYQQAFIDRNEAIADLTAIQGASNCDVYLNNSNAMIKANEGAVSNTRNVIVGGTCANLMLTDGKPFVPSEAFTAGNVTYTRNVVAGTDEWNTFYAPFSCALPSGITAYEYKEMKSDDVMTVTAVDNIEANKAYLMQNSNAEAAVTFTATNAAISAFEAPVTNGLFGSTDVYNVGEQTDIYMLANDNAWHPATANSKSKPFRACFKAPVSAARLRIVVGGQTEISEISNPFTVGDDTIYTLSGQAINQNVKSLPRGVYVINGKKVIIK